MNDFSANSVFCPPFMNSYQQWKVLIQEYLPEGVPSSDLLLTPYSKAEDACSEPSGMDPILFHWKARPAASNLTGINEPAETGASKKASKTALLAQALPCLIGESRKQIVAFIDNQYWQAQYRYANCNGSVMGRKLHIGDLATAAITGKVFYTLSEYKFSCRFCPITIWQPYSPKSDLSVSVLLAIYREKKSGNGFKVTKSVFLPSLHKEDLKVLAKLIMPKNEGSSIPMSLLTLLQSQLQEQIRLFFGIVPSFITGYPKIIQDKGASLFSFDHMTTVPLHPATAALWNTALEDQDVSNHLAGPWSLPGLLSLYTEAINSATCCLSKSTPANDSSATEICQSIRLGLAVQPVEVLLQPFYQTPFQRRYLEHGLTDFLKDWDFYITDDNDKNSSRIFFVSAMLYAAYQPFFSTPSLKRLTGSNVIQGLGQRFFLIAKDLNTLADGKHPLRQSCEFWESFEFPCNKSIESVSRALKAVNHKMCIVLFQGEKCRDLTAFECALLLCSCDVILLANAAVPEEFHQLFVDIKALGDVKDTPVLSFQLGDPRQFPSWDMLNALYMIADRRINQAACDQAASNRRAALQTAVAHSFKKPPAPVAPVSLEDPFHDSVQTEPAKGSEQLLLKNSIAFTKSLIRALSTHKNRISGSLQHLENRQLKLAKNNCTRTNLQPYLPLMTSLCLLGYKHDSLNEPYVASNLLDAIKISFLPNLSLKAKAVEEVWPEMFQQFQNYLKQIMQSSAPRFCSSRNEYFENKDNGSLGWQDKKYFWLNAKRFWDDFIADNPYRAKLKSKRYQFLNDILIPRAGDLIKRDDFSGGHKFCRVKATRDGKRFYVGSFLVLNKDILTRE